MLRRQIPFRLVPRATSCVVFKTQLFLTSSATASVCVRNFSSSSTPILRQQQQGTPNDEVDQENHTLSKNQAIGRLKIPPDYLSPS